MPTDALGQTVDVPLWLLLLMLAYSENRLASILELVPSTLRRESQTGVRDTSEN